MTSFLYIDESKINLGNDVEIYSFNALQISAEFYAKLRQDLHDVLYPLFNIDEKVLSLIPELHYRDFLTEYDDDTKVKVLKAIVEKLVHYKTPIFRVGYYATRETIKLIPNGNKDEFFYQLCWLGIQCATSKKRDNSLMIPVIDAGFEKSFQLRVHNFGHVQKLCNQMPPALRNSFSIPNNHNIADVSYVDSNFSIFLQLIDCIAGMRNETIRAHLGQTLSPYKSKIHGISKLLDENDLIAHEKYIVLNEK